MSKKKDETKKSDAPTFRTVETARAVRYDGFRAADELLKHHDKNADRTVMVDRGVVTDVRELDGAPCRIEDSAVVWSFNDSHKKLTATCAVVRTYGDEPDAVVFGTRTYEASEEIVTRLAYANSVLNASIATGYADVPSPITENMDLVHLPLWLYARLLTAVPFDAMVRVVAEHNATGRIDVRQAMIDVRDATVSGEPIVGTMAIASIIPNRNARRTLVEVYELLDKAHKNHVQDAISGIAQDLKV